MNKAKCLIGVIVSLSIMAALEVVKLHQMWNVPDTMLFIWRWIFAASMVLYSFCRRSLTTWILTFMILGILTGLDFPTFSGNLKFLSTIFLRLVKTLIAPILFSTLVVGIAGHANLRQVGRLGWKSILYFEVVTTLALLIGLVAINISHAGTGIQLPSGFHESLPQTAHQSWQDLVVDIFPENLIKSVYNGDVLPIVVFSVLFALGLARVNETNRRPLIEFSESLAATMFKFTNIIMYFAPVGVGAALAVTVGHLGLSILTPLLKLLLTLYLALLVFVGGVLWWVARLMKIPIRPFINAIAEPVSIAFATTSSESALPIVMENMEKFGVPRKIVSFVIPTGYTFNLDGTALYLSLASIFVAQAAGIHMPFSTQLFMGLTLMLTSKGVAGVPRASLLILIGTLSSFGLPLWPVLALLGIDVLMDMGRTTVNVIGNALGSCVIASWEGEFDREKAMAFTSR